MQRASAVGDSSQSTETQTSPSLNNAFTVDTITEEAPITAAQLALVAQADEAFNGLTFQYSNNIPFKQICALPTVLDDKFAFSKNSCSVNLIIPNIVGITCTSRK